MEEKSLYHMRKDYSPVPLDPAHLEQDPFLQFAKWFDQALEFEQMEANAMIVSTCDLSLRPSSRVVLLKSYSREGFVFFTNYHSKKGRDLTANPNISLLFFWPATMRQVRIEGRAHKVEEAISQEYFSGRPRESKASSALSRQSEPLFEKEQFNDNVKNLIESDQEILRPTHWGGYVVVPVSFEFWQGGIGRAHDRYLYKKGPKGWNISPLYP